METLANNAVTTLLSGISSVATTLTLSSVSAFVDVNGNPLPGDFRLLIDQEIIDVGTLTGAVCSGCVRGAEHTVPSPHALGATVAQALTVGGLTEFILDHTLQGVPHHASTHLAGGVDPVQLDLLGAPSDVTTLNATTAAHGLLPKLSGNATAFLNGVGGWSLPTGVTPAVHAPTHEAGGTDPIPLDVLGAPSDVTTLNVTTTAHGLAPKLSGNAGQYFAGSGLWSTPATLPHHATHETGGSDAVAALDGSVLTTGTVPDARLSANIQRHPIPVADVPAHHTTHQTGGSDALPLDQMTGAYVAVGTNPAQSGAVRLPNAGTVAWRNSANTSDVGTISVSAAGGLLFTATTSVTFSSVQLYPATDGTNDVGFSTLRWRNLYLAGAVMTGIKAAAPVDADVTNPQDGMIRIDSLNNKIWVRIGGVWKGVVVA